MCEDVEARRACLSANGMHSLKPAQAGFLPASRDFSRQAAGGNTLSRTDILFPIEIQPLRPPVFLRRTAGRRRQNDVGVDRRLSCSFRGYAQERGAHPSSRPTRGSPAGLSTANGMRPLKPAQAGFLPASRDFSRPAEPQFQAVRSEAQRSPIQPPHARKPGGLIYRRTGCAP